MRKECRSDYYNKLHRDVHSNDGYDEEINAIQQRSSDKYLFVNPNITASGNGLTINTAYKTFREAIAFIRALSTAALKKGYTIFCMNGLSYEVSGIIIDFDDLLVIGPGTSDGFILIGTGTSGVLDAATDHLLKISGSKCLFVGASLYTYKDTKAAVYLGSATATDMTGSFNKFLNCYFSKQADGDDMGFGVYLQGAKGVEIDSCVFKGCKSGAVIGVNSTIRGDDDLSISNCIIESCKYGLEMDGDGHDILMERCRIINGTDTGEVLTKCVMTTANHASGSIHLLNNMFEAIDKAGSITKTGAGTIVHVGNSYIE